MIENQKIYECYKKCLITEGNKIKLPDVVYKASLGINPKLWNKWIIDNDFTVDKESNLLKDKNGDLWKIDTTTKTLNKQ